LWRYRKGRELSQKRVASLLGHKNSTNISRWESGTRKPTLDSALMLAHVLKTPVESLFAERAAELRAEIEERDQEKPDA
jgi:transcriptional regulator with XRE-family HTH domain